MAGACGCSCGTVRPTDTLKSEHRVIERVLDATERALENGVVDREFLHKAIDFLRNFADGCHHAKEEDELFPMLERAGVPRDGGPIGCMLAEHDMGRALVRAIESNIDAAAAGDSRAVVALRGAARDYVGLLRRHIQKEDSVLFVIADQVLAPPDQADLAKAFERVEQAGSNAGRHERYLKLADELCRRAAPAGAANV